MVTIGLIRRHNPDTARTLRDPSRLTISLPVSRFMARMCHLRALAGAAAERFDVGGVGKGQREFTKMITTAPSAVSIAAASFLAITTSGASAQCGSASWYDLTSQTASGEPMDSADMTAAHRTLPFGTTWRVVNLQNGRSVIVRINDRGPFIKGRMIDLSKGAARELGFISSGHTSICLLPTPPSARLSRL
jgi:rare lipoprotein A